MTKQNDRSNHEFTRHGMMGPIWVGFAILLAGVLATAALAEVENSLIPKGGFLQIPGPNPILTPGKPDSWDDWLVETADIFEDLGTYYLYYHGSKDDQSWYELGVASASHPLGPFIRHGSEPIVPRGAPGSWDDAGTFCAQIVKVTEFDNVTKSKYYMLYGATSAGRSQGGNVPICDIGLATADNPLGPWEKFSGNPVIKDFGYNGGLVERSGKWYLYNAWPISSGGGRDYSSMALATADKLEGPWTKYEGNPILEKGSWGEWDDGGFSEAKVFALGDYLHMFYGGAKPTDPRMNSQESIGYAFSRDGIHWTKYGRNPVAIRQAEPYAAAYAEVRALWEPPFVYCYHTLRYDKPWRERDKANFPNVEDLGVQVLVAQRPFSLDMPVLRRDKLGPKESTTISTDDSRCIAINNVTSASITVECSFPVDAKRGLLVHVRSSLDGEKFDTADLQTFEIPVTAAEQIRQTFPLKLHGKFLKVIVENLDDSQPVNNVEINATLRG
jgi:hypothetical protein